MARERKIEVILAGDSGGLNRALGDADSRLGGLGRSIAGFGRLAAAGMAAAGAAVAGFAVKSVVDFTSFQRQMNEVFTLLPGISDAAMADMTGQVKDFAAEFGVLPERVVPALYQALSAGVPQDNVFAFLETAQKAAKGGVTELETAVDGISSVVNAYGQDVIGATEASDLMFTAVRLGKTTFDDMSRSLFNVTPTAAALGVKFEDVTAAVAALTAQGVPTSVATTQMRQMFVELSKEGSKTAGVFEEVAGKSFKDFIASGGNTSEALQLLARHAADTGVGVNDLFSSVEAGAAALALAGGGGERYNEILAEMGASAGATDEAFERMDQGLGPLIDKLKARFSVFLLDVGEKIAPLVEAALERLGPVVEDMQARFGEFAADVGAKFEKHWPAIRDVILDVVDAVEKHWPKIEEIITDVVDTVVVIVEGALDLVQTLWRNFGDNILRFVQRAFGPVVQTIRGALQIIRGVVQTITALIRGDWSEVWEGIKQIFFGVWEAIQGIVETALAAVRLIIETALEIIGGVFGGAWEAIKSALSTFLDETVDFFEELPGRLVDALKNVGQKIWAGTQAAWDVFKTKISEAVTAYVGFYIGLPGRIIGALATVGQTIWAGTQAAWGFFTIQIANLITGAVEFFRGLPRRAFDALNSVSQTLVDAGRAIVVWVLGGINSFAEGIWHFFRRLPQNIFNILAGLVGEVIDIGRRIVEWIADGIRNGVGVIADAIRDVVRNALPRFGFDPLGRSGPGSDFFRQHGGPVTRGRPYVVGEVGPELFVPNANGTIVPNDDLAAAAVGSSGGEVTVVQLVLDGRVLGEVTLNQLVREDKRRGGLPLRVVGR